MAFSFPTAALDWLLDGCGRTMLVLADSLAVPRGMVRLGFEVTTINRQFDRLRGAGDVPGLNVAVARAEALPFDDCRFESVFVYQILPDIVPGLALPEIARVLRPDGRLLVSHMSRDDTVPWVRRLAALMHTVDPGAMTAQGAADVIATVQASKYFRDGEAHDFRHWQPVTREAMGEMVASTPAVRNLDELTKRRFLDAAAEIHDQTAGTAGQNTLRLPYQLRCWRASVDQNELTRPVFVDDPALVIKL